MKDCGEGKSCIDACKCSMQLHRVFKTVFFLGIKQLNYNMKYVSTNDMWLLSSLLC